MNTTPSTTSPTTTGPTRTWTPTTVAALLEASLATEPGHPARPALTYLRRKPGRGMVAVFGSAGRDAIYTVTVDEAAMAHDVADPTGVTIERFPADQRLGHLSEVMAPTAASPVWQALRDAAARAVGEPSGRGWTIVDVMATPVRYKPGDRCVVRYAVHAEDEDGHRHVVTVVGKLYGDLEEAAGAADLMERLWAAQDGEAWTARPLALAAPVPLLVTEDLGSRHSELPALPGTEVVRFGADLPVDAIRRSARALADLHTSATARPDTPLRPGAAEAAKAAKRAVTVGSYVPGLAAEAERVAASVGETLAATSAETLRPTHGSYKPSQLLFRCGAAVVVDFDQFALADAALDVGYFLAYLRPPGLWYHRAGTRAWFEAAAEVFLSAYDERMAERGVDARERAGILHRSHGYEAALLLKVAARRANRLHGPRPGEVAAMLAEITTCVEAARS